MLECRGLSVRYGRHQALDDVTLHIAAGEIVAILGANGAGKSTLLQAIAGLVPGVGEVLLDGRSIRGLAPHRIVEAGIALVPEGRWIFSELTVLENLQLGAYARRARHSEAEHLDRVLALFPRLAERRRQVARTMSGGEQQMLAIGRAMMSAPSILMLDEPSLGLSPLLCTELFKALSQTRGSGAGILLVEQNAHQALAIADRGYLLENGRIVGEGAATSLAQDAAVQKAYLGGAASNAATPRAPAPPLAAPAPPPVALPVAARANSGVDALIQGSLDELVRAATAIQAEHVRETRGAFPVARPAAPRQPAAPHARDAALEEAIAKIEAAARAAAQNRSRYKGD
jgi:branched-chain amino acid transport system ATP-binding protein